MQWWDAFRQWWGGVEQWLDASPFRAGVASALAATMIAAVVAAIWQWRKSKVIEPTTPIKAAKEVAAAPQTQADEARHEPGAPPLGNPPQSDVESTSEVLDRHEREAEEREASSKAAQQEASTADSHRGLGASPRPRKSDFGRLADLVAHEVTGTVFPPWRTVRELAQAAGEARELREVTQQATPQPFAEWHLEYAPTIRIGSDRAWVFRLTNLADDVTPRRVKVVAKDDFVSFPSGAFWNRFEPLGAETFVAVPDKSGEKGALTCTVSWLEDGRTFTRDIKPAFKLALSQPKDAAQPRRSGTTAPEEPPT